MAAVGSSLPTEKRCRAGPFRHCVFTHRKALTTFVQLLPLTLSRRMRSLAAIASLDTPDAGDSVTVVEGA